MSTLFALAALAAVITAIVVFLHWYSYHYQKQSIIRRQSLDLNICCGTTDGGGINADIVRHADLPGFVQVDDVDELPFADGQFDTVLCSHTSEHVGDPDRFDRELRRVGREVVYILPPLWDLAAALNIREHKWLFLTLRKVHHRLPPRVPLPLARRLHARIGQRVTA